MEGLDKCEMPPRDDITTIIHGTSGLSGPKDQHDICIWRCTIKKIILLSLGSHKIFCCIPH